MASKTNRVSKIHTWKPKAREVIVERDGKLFVCHFEKAFGIDKFSQYNRFLIGKDSYINQLDTITSYTNFFINNYDQDQELVTAYLKIKFALDKNRYFNKDSMGAFIDFLYEVMFTPTMVEKICAMVDENYLDDIESADGEDTGKRKYVKNDKKHLESLEFTNQHIKILLRISFGMKIMSPALFHYTQINHIKIEKDSDIIYRFYEKLFKLFQYGETYDLFDKNGILITEDISEEKFKDDINTFGYKTEGDGKETKYWFTDESGEEKYYKLTVVDMYNKLYVYVKTKVLESNASNSVIFSQREIFGVDVFTVIKMFTIKVLISENLVKYKFNEHWNPKLKKYQESVVGLTVRVETN